MKKQSSMNILKFNTNKEGMLVPVSKESNKVFQLNLMKGIFAPINDQIDIKSKDPLSDAGLTFSFTM